MRKQAVEEAVIYQSKNGALQLKADIKQDTIWATLMQIAELFDTDKSGISRHINNIYKEGELAQKGMTHSGNPRRVTSGHEISGCKNRCTYNFGQVEVANRRLASWR